MSDQCFSIFTYTYIQALALSLHRQLHDVAEILLKYGIKHQSINYMGIFQLNKICSIYIYIYDNVFMLISE